MRRVKEAGITLLALVVTIIILLILAGVTIGMAINGGGLFSKAKEATEKYNNAVAEENEELARLLAMLDSGLPDNTDGTPAGTIVNPPKTSNWTKTSIKRVTLATGAEKIETQNDTVYAVAVGNGDTVPVPIGFWYVGGDLETGVVISDKEADKNKGVESGNTWTVADDANGTKAHAKATELVGNQFVWIPCTSSEYKKVEWTGNAYNSRWDKSTNSAEESQIEKYGGFYIGRYEAGTGLDGKSIKFAEGKDFSSGITGDSAGINGWNKAQSTYYTVGDITYYGNKYQSGNMTLIANQIPYYHADYYTAVAMCKKMYSGNSYVNSGLVTGTQWDAMCNYIKKDVKDGSGTSLTAYVGDVTSNGSSWGNYGNVPLSSLRGKYATVDENGTTSNWSDASSYSSHTGSNTSDVLLTSGSTNTVQKKHLYDVAGNLWEWSQEAAYYNASDDTQNCFMLRGGNFLNNLWEDYPACFRGCECAAVTSTDFGFRPVLYIK